MESGAPALRLVLGVALTWCLACTDALAEETWRPDRLPAQVYVADGTPLRSTGRCFNPPPPKTGCCPDYGIPAPLFEIPCVDPWIQRQQGRRDASTVRFSAGAYHWWNWQRDGGDWTYGYPGFEGTYFWYAKLDVSGAVCWGPIDEAGIHVDFQWTDGNKFRRWYRSHAWLYETYAWLHIGDWGTVKIGQVLTRFGLDTDYTFWSHVPYYNGWAYDPDIMVSWENTWQGDGTFSMDTFFQLLIEEDGVNGSVRGGDAESSSVYDESVGVNVRVVPTWATEAASFALGLSFLGQEIHADGAPNETGVGAAIDATYTWCGFKAFGEYTRWWGTVNESHYLTGGPTDEKQTWLWGVGWTFGAITPRVSYSYGTYWNPGGWERAWIFAVDLNVTSWLVFTLEWVDHRARADGGPEQQYEDGLQVVLNWNL